MDTQEIELLKSLLNLYKKKYSGEELENRFTDTISDLIQTGDIQKSTYIQFAEENDLLPKVKKKTKIKRFSDSGCGSGGYTRSNC